MVNGKRGATPTSRISIKSIPPDSTPHEVLDTYRVALGELMDAKDRETYRPRDGSKSPDFWNKSGSVGFMDITVRNEFVPKVDAEPFPNPDQNPYFDHIYTDCETTRALVILTVGIEPQYRGNGYARLLKQRAEEIAFEWGLQAIVACMIENPIMKALNTKMGYTLYERGSYAVKRLSIPAHSGR